MAIKKNVSLAVSSEGGSYEKLYALMAKTFSQTAELKSILKTLASEIREVKNK